MRWQRAFVGLMAMAALAGCKHAVELYCDEDTPCLPRYPDQPYCDLTGQYPESEGVGRTCIGFPDDPDKHFCIDDGDCLADRPICGPNLECRACASNQDCLDLGEIAGLTYCTPTGTCLACEPDAFLGCDTNGDGDPVLVACASDGAGEAEILCGASCDTDNQRCIDCAPSTNTCAGGPAATDWEYVTCDADGNETSRTTCFAGCDDTGVDAGCLDIDPLNDLATYLDMAVTADPFVFTESASFDTDTGQVTHGGTGIVAMTSFVAGTPGVAEIRVFIVGSLDVVDATVSGSRAIAIVSNGDIVVRGHFSASADGFQGGPGSRAYASGDACFGAAGTAGSAAVGNSGNGGGSFANLGGRGGHIVDNVGGTVIAGGAAGQAPPGGIDTLEPLFGGCAGGIVGGTPTHGGGGGGALQLVSRTRIQLEGGTLSSNGGGGADSGAAFDATSTAPGGGSGGGILLEAPIIGASPGSVFANGGGGGCIQTAGAPGIQAGSNGLLSTSPALGATCTLEGDFVVTGGSGASASSQPGTAGENAQERMGARGAGGGGGLGFIEINTLGDGTIPGLTASPAPSIGLPQTRPQP